MATITLGGNPVNTAGDLPAVGSPAPGFSLTGADMGPVALLDFAGKTLILNIFPSIDTGVCQASVRHFNADAAGLTDTAVLCVSADLPFAAARFCGAEGIENVTTASSFRSPEFGSDYGVSMVDGKFLGLLARAVVVIDPAGNVRYTELVPEIATEPDYAAALAAAK